MRTEQQNRVIGGYTVHAWRGTGGYWYGVAYPYGAQWEISIKGAWMEKADLFAHAERELRVPYAQETRTCI